VRPARIAVGYGSACIRQAAQLADYLMRDLKGAGLLSCGPIPDLDPRARPLPARRDDHAPVRRGIERGDFAGDRRPGNRNAGHGVQTLQEMFMARASSIF